MLNIYQGHAPGHVREAFQNAVQVMIAWYWHRDEPVPETVDFEINDVPQPITIAQACTMVSRCTDQMPSFLCSELKEFGLKTATYAAAAQAMRRWLRWRREHA